VTNLRIPGPTPLPPAVVEAGTREMINHRGPEFAAIITDVTKRLKRWFQTEQDLFLFPSSGTGGLEAAVVNSFSPGETVLGISIGVFGDRFREIGEAYGLNVIHMDVPWGHAADANDVSSLLDQHPDVKGVLITHNETSTGVMNDIRSVGEAIRGRALYLVDGVSSVGGVPIETDAWGIDILVSGSQKAWMVPPGVSMVSVSQRAWEANRNAKLPRYYWDFKRAKSYLERNQTFTTPTLSVFYALQAGLDMMDAEGMDAVFARHRRVAEFTRAGITQLGLQLFAEPSHASDLVTAVKMPEGVDGSALSKAMRTERNIVLGGGQAGLTGKIFRIGHMGYVKEADIEDVLVSLEAILPRLRQGAHAVTAG